MTRPFFMCERFQKAATLAVLASLFFLMVLRPPRPRPPSSAQRIRFVITRLSRYSGTGRGSARVVHALVSLVGILGMFSAIVGALLGPWLADTADDAMDDERFSYWATDDDDANVGCGRERERKYATLRMLEVP